MVELHLVLERVVFNSFNINYTFRGGVLGMKKVFALLLVLMLAVSVVPFSLGAHSHQTYQDGTFMGYSDATNRGYVSAEVTLENDQIVSVVIRGFDGLSLEKPEDYPWAEYHEALEVLPERYVDRNHWDVEIVTAATGTALSANQAVYRAMARARVQPSNIVNQYFDGVFMARAEGTARGWGIAWVTIENDQIVDVFLAETTRSDDQWVRKGADYRWAEFHEALEVMPQRFVEANSPDVEIVTAATSTCVMAIEAVENALAKASRR